MIRRKISGFALLSVLLCVVFNTGGISALAAGPTSVFDPDYDPDAVPVDKVFADLFGDMSHAIWKKDYVRLAYEHLLRRMTEEYPGADPARLEIFAALAVGLTRELPFGPETDEKATLPEEFVRIIRNSLEPNAAPLQTRIQMRDALDRDDTPSLARVYGFVLLKGFQPDSDEVREELRREVIRYATGGKMTGEDAWHMYNLYGSNIAGEMEWAELEAALKAISDPDPWLMCAAGGRAAQARGWQARGEDYAYKVSRDSMQIYGQEMKNAWTLFHQALKLHPERGNPYLRLIDVEKNLCNTSGSIDAFKRAVQSFPDNKGAYESAMWAFLPRWGGSTELLMAAGDACLQSGFLDTIIPCYGFDFYGGAAWDQRGCRWKAIYLRDDVIAMGDKLYQAKLDATAPGWKSGLDYCMFSRMIFEAATLRYDKALATLKEFGGEERARQYFQNEYDWAWCQVTRFYPRMPQLQDVVTEILVGSGPYGAAFAAAEREYLTGQPHRGIAQLGELIRNPDLTAQEREFMLDQLGRWSMPCYPEAYLGPNHRIYSALQVAEKEGFPQIAAILTQMGADPAAAENYPGEAAISAAADGRDPGVLDRLHAKGDPLTRTEPEYGRTPLHQALLRDNERMTAKLIELKVPLEPRDRAGHVPLHLAAVGDSPVSTKLLLDAGVDPDVQDGDGETPLMFVLQVNGSRDMRRLLIRYSKDINRASRAGRTALHFAAQYEKDPQAVRDLIAAGADPDRADASGMTPRKLAKSLGKTAFVEAMEQEKAEKK